MTMTMPDGQRQITYQLTTANCKTDGCEPLTVYGFTAVFPDSESLAFADISTNPRDIVRLAARLRRKKVLKVQLGEIVEDYLVELSTRGLPAL